MATSCHEAGKKLPPPAKVLRSPRRETTTDAEEETEEEDKEDEDTDEDEEDEEVEDSGSLSH